MEVEKDVRGAGRICNHIGGKGEIGMMLNHTVCQAGTIGTSLLNHSLDDAAPQANQVIQFSCNEESLARELGLYCYPIRSYVISNPGDIFQTGKELEPGLTWLQDHFSRVGITCAKDIIFDYSFDWAKEYPQHKLSVFFFGKEAHAVRPHMDRLHATEFFNNKNNVIELAHSLGVQTAQTDMFSSVNEIDLAKYRHMQFPLAVKIANSVSGLGFEKCDSFDQLVTVVDRIAAIPTETPFQIQPFLDGSIFFSAQWWINGPLNFAPITGTQNFIEGDANHAGNWGGWKIPHQELFDFTHSMTEAASLFGLCDWVGFDVALHQGQFYLMECNPRYTGAAYPYVAVQKLFGKKEALETFWAHKNYAVNRSSIDGFHLNGLEFDPKKQEGWIVINPGPLTVGDGKVGMLWIGEKENYLQAEDELRSWLS
ncbi:MAG: hypothetical protein WC823_07175 [Parcubacteria group bacterium]|jgi:hypothetical protein